MGGTATETMLERPQEAFHGLSELISRVGGLVFRLKRSSKPRISP